MNDVENLEEKLGAKKPALANGRAVVDLESNPSHAACFVSSKKRKEFDTQISKETQISAIASDSEDYSDEERDIRKPCI